MQRGFRSLRDCVFHNPLGLSCLPSKTRQLANKYLPRETGVEIEILTLPFDDAGSLGAQILQIGLVELSASNQEFRFQLHSGEKGMIELYKVCQLLKKYFRLNLGSGIHYHTSSLLVPDGYYHDIARKASQYEWVLKELDTWDYKGSFNARTIRASKDAWVAMRFDKKTFEYRIGEMTFDYEVMIRRIVHVHSLTKRIERQFYHNPPRDIPVPTRCVPIHETSSGLY